MSEKKGRASWKPASTGLAVKKAPEGMVGRWVNNDPANVERKQAEGWTFANPITGAKVTTAHRADVPDGNNLDSNTKYRELVYMAMPEETKIERDRYFQELTDKRTASLKKDLEEDFRKKGSGAPVTGRIVIE